jgi:hypothetical protein
VCACARACVGLCAAATRTTTWSWDDATKTLSWVVIGGFSETANLYTTVAPVLFARGAATAQRVAPKPLSAGGGSVAFK